MDASVNQNSSGDCATTIPTGHQVHRQDSKILTVKDAKQKYRESHADESGYRDLVTLLIDSGFPKPFKNDSYYDALVLTEAMFERSNREIRWLTGSGTDGFVVELYDTFVATLERIRAAGGKVRIVMLSDQRPVQICDLMKQFPDTLQVALAKPLSKLQHFIVCDSKIVRVENTHENLSDLSGAHEVKAEVYFNNPEKANMLNTFFDAIWTAVKPVILK